MTSIFCCEAISPFKSTYLDHEHKFRTFMNWAKSITGTDAGSSQYVDLEQLSPSFVVQLVQQINYGPVESKRYFAITESGKDFVEISETNLVQAGFRKLNSYKNFRCDLHDKFFELNVYQKSPVNKHHWGASTIRPAGDIDL